MKDDRFSDYNQYTDVKRFFGLIIMILAALWIAFCGVCAIALTPRILLAADPNVAGVAVGAWVVALAAIGGGIGAFIGGLGMWRQG